VGKVGGAGSFDRVGKKDLSESSGKLVVISGPSGVGKSSILKQALERTGAVFSVSATTRQPRVGEVPGRDYHFVSRPEFEEMIRQGQLLEWAEVFGNYYGTPLPAVRDAIAARKTIVMDIDVQGGLQVHKKMPDAQFVLILPPSIDVLRQRLSSRGTETPESLNCRLAKAQEEISVAMNSGVYNHSVINDDLGKAICQVVAIINQESIAQ
jgi:guanylate kinase